MATELTTEDFDIYCKLTARNPLIAGNCGGDVTDYRAMLAREERKAQSDFTERCSPAWFVQGEINGILFRQLHDNTWAPYGQRA